MPIPFLCIVGIIADWRRGPGSLFLLPHSLFIIGSLLLGAWTVGFPDAFENLAGLTFFAYLGIAVLAVLIVLGLGDFFRIYRSATLQNITAVVVLLTGICWVGYEIALYSIGESRNYPSVPLDAKTILLVERNLGLEHPWKVENIDAYEDGGTRGGRIRGAQGTYLEFSWGNGLRLVEDARPRLLYLGAQHWSDSSAVSVPLGAPKERAFIKVLQSWGDAQIDPDRQEEYLAIYFNYGIPYGERIAQLPPLTENMRRALDALQIIRFIRQERAAHTGPPPPRHAH